MSEGQVRGIRVNEKRLSAMMDHADKMGLSFSDVVNQCIELGFPIIQKREYYHAKLAGVPAGDVADMVGDVLGKLAEKRAGR